MVPTEDVVAAHKVKIEHGAARTTPEVRPSRSDFARSHTANWSPPVPVTSEEKSLQSFKAEWKQHSGKLPAHDGTKSQKQILIIELHDFEIYRSPDSSGNRMGRNYELTSLHYLQGPTTKKLSFDGFVCFGNSRHYVRAVPIQDSSVEGYGDNEDPKVVPYVQSELASKDKSFDIWYRLNEPTPDYKRFQEPFLWVAQFGKHVLDYVEEQPKRSVTLKNFQKEFHQWLTQRFARNPDFGTWHRAFRNHVDFRVGVNAYIDYFYLQAFNLPNSRQLLAHPFWGECMARGSTIVKEQEEVVKSTLATPDVYMSFKDMYFGNCLRESRPSGSIQVKHENRKRKLGFPKICSAPPASTTHPPLEVCQPYGISPVRVGDVIALDPDETDRTVWRDSEWEWLAYVQSVEILENGTQRLFVLWLYRPRETNIFKAKYPFANELFLSDNCNCSERELLSTDVKGKYTVDWSPVTIDTTKRFFIRQTYITQESAFLSVQEGHKTCMCRKEKPAFIDSHHPGDTVYLTKTVRGEKVLEPVVIKSISKATNKVNVRKLLRLERDCAELTIKAHRSIIDPNELVLTDEYEDVAAARLQRRCYVRFVSKLDILNRRIPFPYNRGGAGDLWILTMGLSTVNGEQRLLFLRGLPTGFHEGPNIAYDLKLRGLSIFSGGGSLDRGLEEGGAVEFQTAVDFSAQAIHTQRANTRSPDTMRLYCGSVDDFFKAALLGNDPQLVAPVGEVDFIAAGSPCPGFSALQQDFLSQVSLRNASHISTFCSFVDLYRPQYGVLENVINMASTRKGFEDKNVLSQVVACLVSMGYQVNQYIMDAWSYGSAQQRSRILLTIAAPSLHPIIQPRHTHSRPHNETPGRCLGKLPNGENFGEREHYPTPFGHVSAGAVTLDLPDIGNGNMQTCIPYPDHRLSIVPTRNERTLLKCIPRQPPGCGYKEAYALGLIPPLLQKEKKQIGNAYRRIKEAGLVPTITTVLCLQDSRNGSIIHWSQHRSITILEARRTQGYADDELIVGTLPEQYKIVGNGVDRKVAFAMGLALRQAVEKNTAGFTANGFLEASEELVDISNEAEDEVANVRNGSVTHVLVPRPKKQPAPQPQPSTAIAARTHSQNALVTSKPDHVATISQIPGLDGSSEEPRNLFVASQFVGPSQNPPGLFSRLSQTVARGGGGFSLSSLTPSTKPATIPVLGKRNRQEDMQDIIDGKSPRPRGQPRKPVSITEEATDGHIEGKSARPRSRPRKQATMSEGPQIPQMTNGEVESSTIERSTSSTNSYHDEAVSTKIRHTRHSGLSVEFVPKHWNKRPELEQQEMSR
ncbi:hypothetical protein EJ02DRAFT_422207 [Clathrospora elynae]|uniref:DNA (cytosine-5-)-methyltransferase n=1 Tax=Clathrospora elynae TaxID=706981 RepID=A0A6A5SS16_9PLEO|nr:hypothetical protein EJ02DRAFT_422207 [Clathrospora elynae]